jgi:transglutaminase-like putative cysteine protease
MHEIEEALEDIEPWYKGPIRTIIGIFLILLIILWVIPATGIKQNPEPQHQVKLSDLQITEMSIPQVASSNIQSYVQTTSDIKRVADKIVSLACPTTHKVCNAKAIFYFVRDNFKYVNDPLAYEYYKTPQESFASSVGDCDDGSILLSSLLQSVGFKTRFVFVPRHVYVQVEIPEAVGSLKTEGNWISIDSTCRDCRFGEIHYSYQGLQKRYD